MRWEDDDALDDTTEENVGLVTAFKFGLRSPCVPLAMGEGSEGNPS